MTQKLSDTKLESSSSRRYAGSLIATRRCHSNFSRGWLVRDDHHVDDSKASDSDDARLSTDDSDNEDENDYRIGRPHSLAQHFHVLIWVHRDT